MTADAREEARRVAVGLAAPLCGALLFLAFLGHRSDYVGHFLAGFGATLGALGLVAMAVPAARSGRAATLFVLATALACVGAGAVLESSVFRIARFDPVDFGNQSLGAAFAGAAMLLATARGEPSLGARTAGAIAAVSSLLAGFFFAFR